MTSSLQFGERRRYEQIIDRYLADCYRLRTAARVSELADQMPVRNALLLQRLADIEKLDRKDQEMIVELIHSVLARRSIEPSAFRERSSR